MFRAALRSFVILAALSLVGCDLEEKTVSPFSDKPVTTAQLQQEADQYALKAELDDAHAKSEAERKIAQAKSDAELLLRQMANDNDSAVARVVAGLDSQVRDAVQGAEEAGSRREAAFQAMQARVAAASDDLKRQREQRAQVWGSIKSIVGMIPGAAAVPGVQQGMSLVDSLLLAGGAAGAVHLSKRGLRRQRDEAVVSKEKTEAAAERVVDSIDWLKDVNPAVAEAFATHSEKLKDWQGDAGKALVKRMQLGRAA